MQHFIQTETPTLTQMQTHTHAHTSKCTDATTHTHIFNPHPWPTAQVGWWRVVKESRPLASLISAKGLTVEGLCHNVIKMFQRHGSSQAVTGQHHSPCPPPCTGRHRQQPCPLCHWGCGEAAKDLTQVVYCNTFTLKNYCSQSGQIRSDLILLSAH